MLDKSVLDQIEALLKTWDAIGKALTKEQQMFVSVNLLRVHEFIATPDGQTAIKLFVEEMQKKFTVL